MDDNRGIDSVSVELDVEAIEEMKRSIFTILACISLSLFIAPSSATIHPDVTEDSWFVYDVSIVAKPSFGIFEFSFDGRYNVTITDITGDDVTTDVDVMSSSLPMNVSDIFLPIIVIPTEMLLNDTLIFGNVTISFTNSTELDASKYWRGIPIKTADVGSLTDFFMGVVSTMKLKFDATTGLLYQVLIGAILDLGGGVAVIITLDISLTEANLAYRESMLTRYDHFYDAQFFFSDIVMASWIIPTIILSAVIIILAMILMSTRKQVVKTVSTTGKAKMTRNQDQRSRMKSKAGRKPVKE